MYGPLTPPVPAGPGEPAAAGSLPPLVRGPARCWLRCSVPRVLWAGPQPAAVVRLRWWGESSGGTVLQPAGRAGQPAGRTCARFAVRCGPRQLAAYLADMGVLVLEVLTKRDHLPLGRAQITKLSQLSPSHPIKGSFAVVSPTSDKLGELQVSLVLEPLPELYDTSSCVPATQGGSDAAAQGSSKCQLPAPCQQPRHTQVTVEQESVDSSKATSPRGKDPLLYHESSEDRKDTFPAPQPCVILPDEHIKMSPESQPQSFPTGSDPEALPRRSTRVLSRHSPATKDLLSALLDQGSKLRDAMVVSAMKSSPDMEIELNKISHFIERGNFQAPTKSPKGLKSSFVPPPEDPHPVGSEVSGQQFDLSSEERAIQLLLGSADFSPGQLWDGTGSLQDSLWDSLSLGSEGQDSELGDPHYDQSLLEKLFYTAPKSDSSLSDFLSDDDVKASKKASKTETLRKAGPVNAQKDFHAFDQNVTETKPSCSPTAPPEDHREMSLLRSLGADRLALLQQVHLARVTIESLKIPPESIQISPRRKGLLGKPPRPMSVHKCTFFVEYHFPVRVSKDEKGQVSIATEAIRVASSKITDGVVKFQQQSVFPVWLGGRMMEHWWGSDLAFKVYMRKSTQKKPVAIGSAALQLRRVIEAELLSVSWDIPVEKEGDHTQVGPLKVSLQLVASTTARSARAPAQAVAGAQLGLQEPSRSSGDAGSPLCSTRSPEEGQGPGAGGREVAQPLRPAPAREDWGAHIPPAEEGGLLLHVLLMVPDGKDFTAEGSGLPSSCNVYLNCKLLSTEEATRSAVVWGTRQPAFNFSQVMPFSLTSKHLERLKNNVMIIEAWNKLGSPGSDKLLGLVKLPLHQFYISFKDAKVCQLLLQARYPVVAVDGLVPVVDVFTGSARGSLRVTLAMGSAEQVVALQRLKAEQGVVPPVTLRPPPSLEHPAAQPTLQLDPGGEELVEHVFEIHVESVKGLTPLQSTVWGEADCYIQYHFPVQEPGCGALQGPGLHEDGITLKPFRTATTLCVPDPIFNDEHHHSLLVPADVPVQRLLVSAFMAPGAAGGGIQFEVWCRYYYPNVRDQLVAKGALPLSRLCAMVTLQHREEIGIQTFNLPLVPRSDSSEEFHLRSSGLLDVSVRYQRSLKTGAGITAQAVSLSVQIHKAAGLQAAARAVAQKNPSVQCSAGLGVNAFVRVLPSFLPPAQARRTRAVPCSFCPEFGHHLQFLCHLITQKSSGEASSLGELLQSGSIFFSIYHQSTKSATNQLADRTSRDYLLGTVTIPTRDLLTRRSGVSGWFPVTLSEELLPPACSTPLQAVVGGLELSVAFAQQGDRERVLEAARLLGWGSEELHEHSQDWEQSASPVAVTISTPRVWLPLHCVLLAGQTHLHRSTHCYLRYKLYNQEPTWTWLRRPELSDDAESVTVSFRKPSKVTLRRSQGLLWFFREEKLEIQVWWAYGKEKEVERPLDTDRLIGCAYVDLAALAERSRGALSVSGVYPLFRCNAADLAGAAVRVHVSLGPAPPALPRAPCAEEGSSSSEGGGTGESPALGLQVSDKQQVDVESSGITPGQPQEEDVMFLENTVAVSILVERAMHLSLKGSPLTEREVAAPSSCVSFAVAGADAPVTTPVIANTDSPVWDFQQQARLSKELLLDPQQTLVFKVWHKAESERVIGFASVDLSPLLSGFQLVCGWYNITDFSGQCRGQVKVAVSPLQDVGALREERQARARRPPGSSSVKVSFSARPSNSANLSKQMLNSLSKEVSVPAQEQESFPAGFGIEQGAVSSRVGTQPPRHEEHMRNVRRFHESLQRAEGSRSARRLQGPLQGEDGNGNACRASRGDTAPAPPASRAALLTALRKNLSELDEVQRYFSEKLTRSFPDFSTSRPGHGEWESDHQGSLGREVDPKGCHLLEKSSQLVSQVSSLINDLQTITQNSKAASEVQQEGSRKLGALDVPSWKEGGGSPAAPEGQLQLPGVPSIPGDSQQPCPAGRALFGRHLLHQLLGPIVPEEEDPVGVVQEDEGAFAIQPHSEEEYEEDVIEPRALNEITTMTDGTSPWSSVVSETGQGAELQPLEARPAEQPSKVGCFQGGNSSTLSSMLQGHSQSLLSALSPPLSPLMGGNSPWGAAGDLQGFPSSTGAAAGDFQGFPSSMGAAAGDFQGFPSSMGAAAGDFQGFPSSMGAAAGDFQGFPSSMGAAAGDFQGFPSSTGAAAGDLQAIKKSVELHAGSKELLPSPGDTGLTDQKATEREEEEDAEAVNGDHQGKEGSGSDENCAQSVSAQAGSERNSESFPDDSSEDPVEGPENPIKQKITLSDPVVVPNFFLPPQEMEASMRLLCTSSYPSTPPKGRSGAVPGGIPYRRAARPRPSPQLSEEEAKRIARIFSAQLSKKE
ncbi:C2 domain-containing protein 3 isoform X3 [Haemorhous mexicanus]|uniref:C2 domain-containing protein 3 isoform X3 n=1 Tax=Haemorhous mexicanus TaxID=30427 RepID=UPI0028BE95E3|nr:C2 domain-containing protein 3 isoform X3 [Haemorhous mexicanus]